MTAVTEAWFYEVANRLVSWRDRVPGFSMSAAEVLTSILTEAGVSLPIDDSPVAVDCHATESARSRCVVHGAEGNEDDGLYYCRVSRRWLGLRGGTDRG